MDPSPNAGRSEAIYAHCAGVQLGGRNRYGDTWITKPVLKAGGSEACPQSVETILNLSKRLEIVWLITAEVVPLFLINTTNQYQSQSISPPVHRQQKNSKRAQDDGEIKPE